jgi:hypothetical protein
MKKIITLLSVAAVTLAISTSASAAEKKQRDPNAPRTITGVGVCGKCKLGEADKCTNVVQMKRKGKDGQEQTLTFTLADNDVAKDAHGKFFCKGETPVAVTGTVKREGKGKDAKMILTATKIEAPKKGGKGKGKKKKVA